MAVLGPYGPYKSAMFVLSVDLGDQDRSNIRNSLGIPAAILFNMQAATAPRNKFHEP